MQPFVPHPGRAHQPAGAHIAASDFFVTLGKINRELGTTILLTEHRLEEEFPRATRVQSWTVVNSFIIFVYSVAKTA